MHPHKHIIGQWQPWKAMLFLLGISDHGIGQAYKIKGQSRTGWRTSVNYSKPPWLWAWSSFTSVNWHIYEHWALGTSRWKIFSDFQLDVFYSVTIITINIEMTGVLLGNIFSASILKKKKENWARLGYYQKLAFEMNRTLLSFYTNQLIINILSPVFTFWRKWKPLKLKDNPNL